METKTVHVSKDNCVLLCCPSCGFSNRVSVEKYKGKKFSIAIRCKCASRFQVQLNFRKNYRKSVILPGKFRLLSPMSNWMEMNVCDLSMTGIGLKTSAPISVKEGDSAAVTFNLDSGQQALISQNVIVKAIIGDVIGCEFTSLSSYEKDIGFYLMPG